MPVPSSRQLYREFLAQPLRSQASHNPVHSQPGSFRVYLELVGEYRRAFLVIFIAACLTELLYLAVPVTTRHIIDAVLMNTRLAPADKARLLALVASGFIPPLIYISLIYILRVRPVYRSVSNDRSAQDARTSEVFTGIRAVKAFGMQYCSMGLCARTF